ncbi:MAG: tRNA (adenosine(37)-N6)-threonylcarbamoyltransferase complex dimerization subunit type 1 TsaB [Chlamydiota bacterium]|nr:tRNA (adenosine(37)-N6)-threonylcarbamoyltransferase complex dimerization subunit type 1 TsaB [Chlamydiota bacterium]
MKVIGIETSSRVGTIALVDGETVLGKELISENMEHAGFFEEALARLFFHCDISLEHIDGFAVSIGPGSFTGIRVGISIAKGLNMSLQKPIVGVATLQALCKGALGNNVLLCPVIAGEAGEIYGALFERIANEITEVIPEFSVPAGEIRNKIGSEAYIFGPALAKHYNTLSKIVDLSFLSQEVVFPQADKVAVLGQKLIQDGYNQCEPRYIKPLKVFNQSNN